MVGLLFKTKQNRKTTPSKKRSGEKERWWSAMKNYYY
jgi:hypothetical protein